jgi:hypothetical protein
MREQLLLTLIVAFGFPLPPESSWVLRLQPTRFVPGRILRGL